MVAYVWELRPSGRPRRFVPARDWPKEDPRAGCAVAGNAGYCGNISGCIRLLVSDTLFTLVEKLPAIPRITRI